MKLTICAVLACLGALALGTPSAHAIIDDCPSFVTEPTADFGFTPASPAMGQSVSFDASSSTGGGIEEFDPPSCTEGGFRPAPIRSYTWDFGDGTPEVSSSSPTTTHTFSSGGSYTVELTVAAGAAGSDSITQTVTVSGPPSPPSAAFDWSMPDRARDANQDGRLDGGMPAGGWDPAQWSVNLNACASTGGGGTAITEYKWEITGRPTQTTSNCHLTVQVPEEDNYEVKLTVTNASGQTGTQTHNVPVINRLIVAMGDSYASGEGNPHTPVQYGFAWILVAPATWDDARCHRSMHAASAQAALALEKDDPRTSVTYISRACTGAEIPAILDGYDGGDPDHTGTTLPPQIDEIRGLVGEQRIDDLLISIGGNDIGFAKLVTDCVLTGHCNLDYDGVVKRFDDALLNLRENRYPRLMNEVTSPARLPYGVRRAYLTQYPDATTKADGTRCDVLLADWTGGLGGSEVDWAADHVLAGLNAAGAEAVSNRGGNVWRYVDGVAAASQGHGYCAGDARWIRTFVDSCDLQGPKYAHLFGGCSFGVVPGTNQTLGTLHPNVAGHTSISQRYLTALRADWPRFDAPPADPGGGGGDPGGGGGDPGDGGDSGGGGGTGTGDSTSGGNRDSTPPAPPTNPSNGDPSAPAQTQTPAGQAAKGGKCSTLKGKKRKRCVKKACGRKKGKKRRTCVKKVTRAAPRPAGRGR